MYPENPEGTQVIAGSVNMGYISDTARNRAHNLFRPKREPIPLGHGDGILCFLKNPKVGGIHNGLQPNEFLRRKEHCSDSPIDSDSHPPLVV